MKLTTFAYCLFAAALISCGQSSKTEEDVAAIRAHLDKEAAEKEAAKVAEAKAFAEIRAKRAAEKASAVSHGG